MSTWKERDQDSREEVVLRFVALLVGHSVQHQCPAEPRKAPKTRKPRLRNTASRLSAPPTQERCQRHPAAGALTQGRPACLQVVTPVPREARASQQIQETRSRLIDDRSRDVCETTHVTTPWVSPTLRQGPECIFQRRASPSSTHSQFCGRPEGSSRESRSNARRSPWSPSL